MRKREDLTSLGVTGHPTVDYGIGPAAGHGHAPAGQFTAVCDECKVVLADEFFKIQERIICPACATLIREQPKQRRHSWLRIAAYGLAAALASLAFSTLAAIVFKWIVPVTAAAAGDRIGRAMRAASRGFGSGRQQILAVALTFFSISASLWPLFLPKTTADRGASRAQTAVQSDKPRSNPAGANRTSIPPAIKIGVMVFAVGGVVLFGLWFNPFLVLFFSPLFGAVNLALIAFGLYRAWKLTSAAESPIEGPFKIRYRSA